MNSSLTAEPSASTNGKVLAPVQQDADLVEDIVYAFRPLAIWCPPIRKPAGNPCHWVRRSGSAELRLTCNPLYGLPYGQDRLVLILLATLSVMQNVQTVSFTSAYEVLRKFGQAPDGRNYRRLVEKLNRCLNVSVSWRWARAIEGVEFVVTNEYKLIEDGQLWCSDGRVSTKASNTLALSTGFWNELRASPLPISLRVVRQLLPFPGNLDLYIWLAYRSHRIHPGRFAKVPLFGADGLIGCLGVSDCSQRDFRRSIRRWLARIMELIPNFPALLSPDGNHLHVWYKSLVHNPLAKMYLEKKNG